MAIEARDLCKSYGHVQALRSLTFQVPASQIFGFLGHNGAGKTTAIKILTTVLRADSGSARVLGWDVRRNPERIANQMTTANAYLSEVFLFAYFPMLLVLMPFFNVNEGLLGWLVHALPSYYFADLLRIAITRTPDLAQFALTVGICLVWIAAAGALSVWTLRRQQV